MWRKIFILFTLSAMSLSAVFAQGTNFNIRKIESVAEEENEKLIYSEKAHVTPYTTSIFVKTNVSGAKVYLNGVYQGISNLEISKLKEGTYILKVEKEGYKTEVMRIQAKKGKQENYYVELKKWTGWVTFECDPLFSSIYVDNKNVDSTVELDEGAHNVVIKRFGYETFRERITVSRKTHQYIEVKLAPAEFRISGFETKKPVFNPRLQGGIGHCPLSFEVSNDGSARLEIFDRSENLIHQSEFTYFSTWQQNYVWDGTDLNGQIVSDGSYIAVLTAKSQVLKLDLTVDSSIRLSMSFFGNDGLSVGNIGVAMINPADVMALYVSAGLDLTNHTDVFYGVPVRLGLNYAFSSWCDMTVHGGYIFKNGKDTFDIGGSLKFVGQNKSADHAFDYAVILRACGNEFDLYEPCGCDAGRGFGGGIALGVEKDKFYAGVLTEFIFNAIQDDHMYDMDRLWRNGVALQLKNEDSSCGVYAGLNSVFGKKACFNRSFEAGVDWNTRLSGSNAFLNVRSGILCYIDSEEDKEKLYSRSEIGIQYLFD